MELKFETAKDRSNMAECINNAETIRVFKTGSEAIQAIFDSVFTPENRADRIAATDRFNDSKMLLTLDENGEHVLLQGDFKGQLGTPLYRLPHDLAQHELTAQKDQAGTTVLIPRWTPSESGGSPNSRISYDVYAWDQEERPIQMEEGTRIKFEQLSRGQQLLALLS